MMSDGGINTAINPFSRRKKKFKQKNSSSGILPQLGDWHDNSVGTAVNPRARRKNKVKQNNSPRQIRDAAAPKPEWVKTFNRQKSSASAAPPPSARGSGSAAVNPRTRRKKRLKKNHSSTGIPPPVEDWDSEILDSAHGVKDGVSLVSRDAKLNGPLTGGYIPAIHHAQPVRWLRKNTPLEPDQFADADSAGTPPQVEDRDCGIAAAATELGSVPVDGVEGGICGALQDLTLSGPLPGAYTPAVHHAQPVHWVRLHLPIEADQFADADESSTQRLLSPAVMI